MHMCLHIGIKFEWGDSKKGFSAKWLRAHQANKNPLLHSEIRFSMHGISNWKWLHFYCIASKFSMNRRKERPSILIFLCYYSRNECWIQQKCWLTGRAMYNKKDKHKMEKNDNLSRLNWFLGNWRKIRRKKMYDNVFASPRQCDNFWTDWEISKKTNESLEFLCTTIWVHMEPHTIWIPISQLTLSNWSTIDYYYSVFTQANRCVIAILVNHVYTNRS